MSEAKARFVLKCTLVGGGASFAFGLLMHLVLRLVFSQPTGGLELGFDLGGMISGLISLTLIGVVLGVVVGLLGKPPVETTAAEREETASKDAADTLAQLGIAPPPKDERKVD